MENDSEFKIGLGGPILVPDAVLEIFEKRMGKLTEQAVVGAIVVDFRNKIPFEFVGFNANDNKFGVFPTEEYTGPICIDMIRNGVHIAAEDNYTMKINKSFAELREKMRHIGFWFVPEGVDMDTHFSKKLEPEELEKQISEILDKIESISAEFREDTKEYLGLP